MKNAEIRPFSAIVTVIAVLAGAGALYVFLAVPGRERDDLRREVEPNKVDATTHSTLVDSPSLPGAPSPGPWSSPDYLERMRKARETEGLPPCPVELNAHYENLETSQHAIRGEYAAAFNSRADMTAFAGRAEALGITILDTVDDWNMVRFAAGKDGLPGGLFDNLQSEPRFWQNPIAGLPIPDVDPAKAARTDYLGFGPYAAEWLGVPKEHSDWGKDIIVAILDSGVGIHPDLNEDNIERISMLEEDSSTDSGNGHGTAVASILAGTSKDNPGMAPAARLLSVQVLDGNGAGDSFTLAKGIIEAVNQGADVINICISSPDGSPVLSRAVEYALANNVSVVAATGNDSISQVAYPARYEGVIAVSAVDARSEHLFFANSGEEVDIAAPGLAVEAAWADGKDIDFSGTSAAVPFVSGAIAAILSQGGPSDPAEVAELLASHSNDVGLPGKDEEVGAGVLNLERVLQRDQPGIIDVAIADHHVVIPDSDDEELTIYVTVQNRGTERIEAAELMVKMGEDMHNLAINGMDVGETVGYEFPVQKSLVSDGKQLPVQSAVRPSGTTDSKLDNNTMGTSVSLTSE